MNRLKVPVSIILHFLLAYVVMMLTRAAYLIENLNTLGAVFQHNSLSSILAGCFIFDTSAIMYANAIVAILIIFLPFKWNKVTTIFYTILNSACIVMNLCDAVYFKYTGHRTTATVFDEFSNENNLVGIFWKEIVGHWYFVILGVLLIVLLYVASRKFFKLWQKYDKQHLRWWENVLNRALTLIIFVFLCFGGMRGGFSTAIRPITISNANKYVSHPTEAALILNTPFALFRTLGKNVFVDPGYFDESELDAIYTPMHESSNNDYLKKNVVILIVESLGREYVGSLNQDLEGGNYRGYTPFIDSLLGQSLYFEYSFTNGRKSIDALPSILSGIPHFIEPFILTPSSLNDVNGIASELAKIGYTSAFFHGAENGSMGFDAFVKSIGFQEYYGRTEYKADGRFDGDKDFDGTWAIWDEEFLQFYALKMSDLTQPFVTSVFTASSHHPFVIPEKYKDVFVDDFTPKGNGVNAETNPMHKCIQYTDMAIRRFFETAKQQTWYDNTLFVLTADHPNKSNHDVYCTDFGLYEVPIIFYDPSGVLPRGKMDAIAQQTDILPTLLSIIGYDKPHISWGVDLLNTSTEDTWAVNYSGASGIYQFVKGDLFLQFDGSELKAVYKFKDDRLLSHNLIDELKDDVIVESYERELKGIIQSYMQRMERNELVVK